VTFMSSALIRRDCLEMAFVRGYHGTSLTPCAAVLAAVGKGGRAVVSTTTMINARGGNSGGYNVVEVFSRNLKAILADCERFGYSRTARDHVLADSLTTAVPDAIWNSPWQWSGLLQVTKSCAFRRPYATKVLPAYSGALIGATRRFLKGIAVDLPGRILLKLLRRQSASSYEECLNTANELAHRYAKEQIRRLGPGSSFSHPVYLSQPRYLKIGRGFTAGPGVRLEACDQYGEDRFAPEIEIGDNVIFSHNVHVGAIDRVRIGNDVLVGSNVLITDHGHGIGDLGERVQPPRARCPHSKGPVTIEDRVWIGENAAILSGVRVGQGAIVEPNSVVTCDVPAYAVVGGAPARILGHKAAP
jgi:acetyltransferase-like isoleucine patch superfamily enzyme